jgi:hypothetical protein
VQKTLNTNVLVAMQSSSDASVAMMRLYISSANLVQQIDESVLQQIIKTISELVKLAGMFDPGAVKTWIDNSANIVASLLMVLECDKNTRLFNILEIRDKYLSCANGHDQKVLNAAFKMIITRVKEHNLPNEAGELDNDVTRGGGLGSTSQEKVRVSQKETHHNDHKERKDRNIGNNLVKRKHIGSDDAAETDAASNKRQSKFVK